MTFLGGNGYSLNTHSEILSALGLMLNPVSLVPLLLSQVGGLAAGVIGGAPNPYTYPENLPRVNGRGGPGGGAGLLAADHPATMARTGIGDGRGGPAPRLITTWRSGRPT